MTPYDVYGDPYKNSFIQKELILWNVDKNLIVGYIPKRIYCHKSLVPMLQEAFKNLIERKCVYELKTWDGCYNLRPIRGFEKKYAALLKAKDLARFELLSYHSWGLAIDVNRAENDLGKKPKLSKEFVKCFTDAGFVWGGTFKRLDGMHFQKILQN